jgi:hypothetical protein
MVIVMQLPIVCFLFLRAGKEYNLDEQGLGV